MRAASLSLIVLFIYLPLKSQELVPNGSFESFTALPNDDCDWFLASGWTNAALTGFCNPSNGTPDYYHHQGTGPFSALPSNYFAQLLPLDGDAIMGLVGYINLFPNAREYISIQLVTPLEVGVFYQLSFSLTPGTPASNSFAVNGWGAALTVNPLFQPAGTNAPIPLVNNQFIVPAVISQSSWQTYSFEFIADLPYNYITIGNFRPDNQLTIQTNGNPGFFTLAYMFVDKVSIVPFMNSLPISLLSFNVRLNSQNHTDITWTTSSETNNSYFTVERSLNGTAWEHAVQVEGAGNSNTQINYFAIDKSPYLQGTYYRLKQTDFDGKYSYSDVRYVGRVLNEAPEITAQPNPCASEIFISLNGNEEDIEIFDNLGRKCTDNIKAEPAGTQLIKIDVSQLSSGLYYAKSGSSSVRFVKL